MIQEAIVLAGGFGTRLSHVVSDVPKPMAPVDGRPFLEYLLDELIRQGFRHVVLSTGHLHEKIEEYFGVQYRSLQLDYAYEAVPLGTGGGIMNALRCCREENVAVFNGDTMFRIDFSLLENCHRQHNALLTLALRQVDDTARYGRVQTTTEGRIENFIEKTASKGAGLINGGIYLLNRDIFPVCGYKDSCKDKCHCENTHECYPPAFSFEKELMEPNVQQQPFYAIAFDGYFIDIGIPDDYYRAQDEFKDL